MTAENECIGHRATATMMMVKNVINESGKCEHNGPQHPFNLRSLLSGYTGPEIITCYGLREIG